MTDLVIKNGKYVYADPSVPRDGGAILDAAIAIPVDFDETINGASVTQTTHEFVITRNKPDARIENAHVGPGGNPLLDGLTLSVGAREVRKPLGSASGEIR